MLRLRSLLFLIALLPGCLFATSSKNLIFAYGCLINANVRCCNGSQAEVAIPARISPDFGHVRSWNFCGPSYSALGLRPASPGNPINGVVYAVDVKDMKEWDQFEQGYRRIEVPREQVEFLGWMEPKADCKIWVYLPQSDKQQFPTAKSPLMQSYLDAVLQGCLDYGDAFTKEFLKTTEDWPRWWLNDRVTSPNPWALRRQQKHLDSLIEANVPQIAHRKDYDAYQRLLGAYPISMIE